MKPWFALGIFTVAVFATAEPLTLVNTLAERPVFNLMTSGVTLTRTIAPGSRVRLEAGLFSGLGEKKILLTGGTTYYWAKFGATPGLFVLAPGQVLILNQSSRVVSVSLGATSGLLASGNFALGALDPAGRLNVEWGEGSGIRKAQDLDAGGVYRLVLDSPAGTGTTVNLQPWD